MINPILEQQKRELEKINICTDILRNARNELYLSMRFFDVILSKLEFMPKADVEGFATDGYYMYFYPDYVLGMYQRDGVKVNRSYLHMVFHCLFNHLDRPEDEEEPFWDLACDIVVESIIDSLQKRSVRAYVSPYRKNIYRLCQKEMEVLTPKGVYRILQQMNLDIEELMKMRLEFYVDNHEIWKEEIPPEQKVERQNQWKDLNEKLQTEMETIGKESDGSSDGLLDQVQVANRERYDYKKFLRKFAILKEEMQVDTDSFDYIFYNYGMNLYGNMPLIEPQETKEVWRVEDFVIAIDTSMSCKEHLIKQFLEETYSILSEKESFSRRINVHIIQCDDQIQSDVVVRNYEELQNYMEHFEIKGYGGTDFRPVFGYMNQLLRQKVFQRLKGLIYFTDGYGTFPAKRPLYETAFVFLKEDYRDIDVPAWAMKLIIEPEELEHEHKKSKARD